jgi:cyclophilin family peptidyl-prolyl cis-trans isomerase
MVVLSSCVGVQDPGISRPEGPSDLAVVARANVPEVFEGIAVTLTATVSGGRPPYFFRWDRNAGPEEVTFTAESAMQTSTAPLTSAGRFVFRVVVTDADGFHDSDFVAVEVSPAAATDVPALAIVGEPTPLSAELQTQTPGVAVEWRVVSGNATIDNAASLTPNLTASAAESIELEFTVTIPVEEGEPVRTTRSFEIAAAADLHPRVLVETNFGSFAIELEGELAQRHTANFLLYSDDGFYDGLLFHRNSCTETADGDDEEEEPDCVPFVLQGGGFERVDGELTAREPTRAPVPSEAENGLSNGEVYSVALALVDDDPQSGTTQFFINLSPENDFLDKRFTVFGRVVEGTGVVDTIIAMERTENPLLPGETSLPVEDVVILSIRRGTPG